MSDLASLNEAVTPLVERARSGDAQAFTEVVRCCHRQIFRWALAQTADPDEADDVTQEVLVRLQAGLSRFRFESRFTTWLFRVTRNVAAGRRRRETRRMGILTMNREVEPSAAVADPDPAEDAARAGALAAIVRYYRDLPAMQRTAFDLADLQGMSPVAAAEMLDMNPATFRVHLLRARRAIRARMLEHHPALVEDVLP